MKYLIGVLIGSVIGFLLGFIWYQKKSKTKQNLVKFDVGSYLTRIGELRVYRAYMKEIVTSVDHVWGEIGKKILLLDVK